MGVPQLDRTFPDLKEAESIQRFWEVHYDDLLKRYPEQFVAVRDDKVVAANPDLALLIYHLRDMGLDARADVAIEFVTARAKSLLL